MIIRRVRAMRSAAANFDAAAALLAQEGRAREAAWAANCAAELHQRLAVIWGRVTIVAVFLAGVAFGWGLS